MKKFNVYSLLGILSIVTALLFSGIPVGKEGLVLGYCILFLVLNFAFILIGILSKKDKVVALSSLAYVIALFGATALIELKTEGYKITVLGWLVSFIISVVGLYRIFNLKKEDRKKGAIVLNIIGLVLSIANLIMGLVTSGGFIVG